VTFVNEGDAAKAIEKLDGYELGGRKLRVNPAEDRPRRPPMLGRSPDFSRPPGGRGDGKPFKSKGSRRGLRGKKRSL
jgi:RNA recognition motif-containing protein